MNDGALVIAFHACDITTRDGLVTGQLAALKKSEGDYDWLGPGTYFFENDADRALQFAQTAHENPDLLLTRQPIATPAVVGAVLCVSTWLDMTTQAGLENWRRAYRTLKAGREALDEDMPVNRPARDGDDTIMLRHLDCAVFTLLHKMREQEGLPEIGAVRAAFYQGSPLLQTSTEFRDQTHVQIALCKDECVQGWFLPKGSKLLPPDRLEEAVQELARARARRTTAKKRVRPQQ